MNILVTGGTGFIGTKLVDSLRKSNGVFVVDHKTGDFDYVSYFECNYSDSKIDGLLPIINTVYHLAWSGTPAANLSRQEQLQQNINPTLEFAAKLKKSGIGCFVFLSSAGAVYGGAPSPFKEDQKPEPINNYGKAKLTVEEGLKKLADSKFKVIIVRATNIIHPDQKLKNNQGLIPALVDSIKSNKPFELWGDSKKDYLSMEDLIEFLNIIKPGEHFNIFNVGSGLCFTTKEIVKLAEKVSGKSIEIIEKDRAEHDTQNVEVDLNKLKKIVGWVPTTNMKNYIEDVLRKQFENA